MNCKCDVCNNLTEEQYLIWINPSEKMCEACFDRLEPSIIKVAKEDYQDQLSQMEDMG